MKANLGVCKPLRHAFLASVLDDIDSASMRGNGFKQRHRRDLSPQVIAIEQRTESRQSLLEMMSDLTLQFGFLLHQIASMSGENLKLLMDRINGLFEQAEAVDCGSEDGVQIVVIGLVVAMFRLAVEARCERMDQACFIACVAEGPHRWLMIRASHFDGDNQVLDVMLFDRLFECQHGELKTAAAVFNAGRLSQHVAIEIGEPPSGSRFRTIDGDDAKLLRPDSLDTLLNNSLRSAEYSFFEFL